MTSRSLYRVFVVAGSEAHIGTMGKLEKFKEKLSEEDFVHGDNVENDGKPTGDEPMDLTFGNRSDETRRAVFRRLR